ncbi:hypothetical protein ACH4YO_06765 [Streptomyces noursei]|uniref:hypothetical protein n=1 Tax=Streptomyces noursei TaxID=1971 RepID=UPI0033E4D163
MPYRTRRRVLNHFPMSEDIDLLAHGHGWPISYSQEKDFERGKGIEVNWEVSERLTLGYLESHIANVCCVVAVGHDPEEAERLISDVETKLPNKVIDVAEILLGIQDDSDPRKLAKSLVRAGFGAPITFDEQFFKAFEEASTTHPIHNVRSIAITSIAYIEWPEFMPVLRTIESTDPNETVRARATLVLRAYEATEN